MSDLTDLTAPLPESAYRNAYRADYDEACTAIHAIDNCRPYRDISRYVEYLEGQIKRLEKLQRDLLPALTAAQRAEVLMVMHGRTTRDERLLSATEGSLIDGYRAMQPDDRTLVQRLVRRLLESYSSPEEAGGDA